MEGMDTVKRVIKYVNEGENPHVMIHFDSMSKLNITLNLLSLKEYEYVECISNTSLLIGPSNTQYLSDEDEEYWSSENEEDRPECSYLERSRREVEQLVDRALENHQNLLPPIEIQPNIEEIREREENQIIAALEFQAHLDTQMDNGYESDEIPV